MKAQNKIFVSAIITLLVLFTVSGLVSAATLELTSVSIPSTVNHNQAYTLTFTLKNTGATNQTGLTWLDSTIIQGTIVQLPTLDKININETKQLSAIINVPKGTSGNIKLDIKVRSDSEEVASLIKTITINNTPTITIAKKQELSASQNGTAEVKNDGNTILNIDLAETSNFGVTLSKTQILSLLPGQTDTFTVSLLTMPQNLNFGDNSVIIQGVDSAQNAQTTVPFILKKTFCKAGQQGENLTISTVNIDNVEGRGDDNQWNLLDIIEVEVNVENNGDANVREVVVALGLFDSSGKNKVSSLDFENSDEDKIKLGTINDGSNKRTTFRFKVPADMQDGSYKLAVKTYSDKDGENKECTDISSELGDGSFESIDIQREDSIGKFIAFDNIVLTPSEAVCGDSVSLSADVYNIGDEDQDQVKVILYSKELNINQEFEIRNNLDQGDNQKINFDFLIPQTGLSNNKPYQLKLSSEYDYSSGSYDQSSDIDKLVPLKIISCSTLGTGPTGNANAIITAQLTSEAETGKQLIVRSTITNTMSQQATFVIGVSGHQSWSTLSDVSDRILQIAPGQSKDITFTFDVNEDAEGEQSFTIESISGDKTDRKEVFVEIAGTEAAAKPGFSFGSLGENAYLWIIGAVNVILIVLIIIVAVRVSR